MIIFTIGWSDSSFSNTPASVLQPVFVFLDFFLSKSSFSKSNSPNCLGDERLNSPPAIL